MFTRQIDAVLTLIALSIFADKRVLSEEITAFVSSADLIQRNVHSDISITETKLLLWFELNRTDLRDKMNLNAVEFEQWFEALLSDLPTLSDMTFIADISANIFNADSELHISEKALGVILERKLNIPATAA